MDGEQVRGLAARVAAVAEQVRAEGARVASASGVQWRSTAAAGFRERLAEQAAQVRRAARAVDDVAAALTAHARALEAALVDGAGLAAGVARAAEPVAAVVLGELGPAGVAGPGGRGR